MAIEPLVPSKTTGFPVWIFVGGAILAAGFLPTLAAPFDFMDDGNLVYPAQNRSFTEHLGIWWEKVGANVDHLGPFRPVVWAHWQLAANTFGADAFSWRFGRLLWCGLSASMLLWFFRELKLHPIAALLAAAAAMWNPYRSEIWTSLTLAEGVAMPYAMLALIASRKAVGSNRAWLWDIAAVFGLLMALGCKNTFVALIPPMTYLRMAVEGSPWRTNLKERGLRAAFYLLPMLMPVIHLAYIKLHPAPDHYRTPGPSFEQAMRFLGWMKGAAGLDFLGVGLIAILGLIFWKRKLPGDSNPLAFAVGGLIFLAGFAVYLPVEIMCGRYTMPAVWGCDIVIAALLGRVLSLPIGWPVRVAWVAFGAGLIGLVVAGANRQEKLIARTKMLWNALETVEKIAPYGSRIAWVGNSADAAELNPEEGIHFYWHLLHRGRGDIRIGLVDEFGQPIPRTELPPLLEPADYRMETREAPDELTWRTAKRWTVRYRFGWKAYDCLLQERRATDREPNGEALAEQWIRDSLRGRDPLNRLKDEPREPGIGFVARPGTPQR